MYEKKKERNTNKTERNFAMVLLADWGKMLSFFLAKDRQRIKFMLSLFRKTCDFKIGENYIVIKIFVVQILQLFLSLSLHKSIETSFLREGTFIKAFGFFYFSQQSSLDFPLKSLRISMISLKSSHQSRASAMRKT